MKKLITLLLIPIMLLAGCQPTPEESVVMQKDMEQMIENAGKSQSEGEESKSIRERLNAPERFEYNTSKGNLSIEVNTEIFVPDADKMPIIQVKAGEFSQDQIDRIWDALVGDTEMWQESGVQTKSEIQSTILSIKRHMQEADYEQSHKENDENRITELEKQYQTAPEVKPAPIRVDSKLQKEQQIDDATGKVMVETMSVYGTGSEGLFFSAQNIGKVMPEYTNQYGPGSAIIEYAADASRYAFGEGTPKDRFELGLTCQLDEQVTGFVKTTPAEVIIKAEELIGELDIPMQVRNIILSVYYSDEAKKTPVYYIYDVQCVRAIDGLPVPYILGSTYVEQGEGEEQYNVTWSYENLTIGINDKGVSEFKWKAPLQLLDNKVENSALLPFSDIQSIFEKMMPITYEFQAEGSNMTLEIKGVRLEMMRVVEQGSVENGLLIPVWNFYGIRHRKFSSGNTDSTINYILLCVNAIDGSIIDTTKGY